MFGYYVPAVRHFTALVAGISRLESSLFAIFAYLGALIWSTVFISIGYFLGEQWEQVFKMVHRNVKIAAVLAVILLLLYIFVQQRKSNQA